MEKGVKALIGAKEPTDYGDAHFATLKDLKTAGYLNKTGILLGRLNGKDVRTPEPMHIATFGTTGSGKTSSFMIPTMLSSPNSTFIVLDPKGREMEQKTASYLKKQGYRVIRLDPTHPMESDGYNPLEILEGMDKYKFGSTLSTLVSEIIPATGNKGQHFDEVSQMIVSGVAAYKYQKKADGEELTITEILDVICGASKAQLKALIDEIQRKGDRLSKVAVSAYDNAGEKGEKGSFFTTMARRLRIWGDEGVLEMSRKGFSMKDVITDKQKTVIYIQIPVHKEKYYGPWARVIIGCFLMEFLEAYEENGGQRLDKDFVMLLDECWALGKSTQLETCLKTLRGAGVSIGMCYHSPSQIKDIYGSANNIIDYAEIWQISGGEKNMELLKMVSDLAGETTIEPEGESKNDNGKSISKHKAARKLVQFAEPRMLKEDEKIVLAGNLTMKLTKIYSWKDKKMAKMLNV